MNNSQLANKPEEILDLVDENDEIIGEVVRKKANSSPNLIHREISVIIIDKNNKILLQKRSKYKTVNPNMWSLTAGHVLKGDDLLETAHRELEEELGFDTSLIFINKKLQKYVWETHFMYYYLGIYDDEVINFESTEVSETKFFSQAELKEFIKNDGLVNLKHIKILDECWDEVYAEQIKQLK
ncbi:MAG: NUDIX domain-containing protein [Pseudomonadales bacterium]|nr:NUDIX domain-containing protein [Pseudomonadales bacterium]